MDGAPGAGTPELEVRLLGPITVVRGAEAVALGGLKPRALLTVLALEPGNVVSVDAIVEALWPGDPPDTAAHAVQVYVSQLRKALGPVIATRPPGYALELVADRIDVHRFMRLAADGRASLQAGDPARAEIALREALGLWHGPPLADFAYEPFAQTQIATLEEFRATVLEERVEADLALGRHVQLVPELEALVQADRLRERTRAQLMLALYRSGRQADALAAYRAARETLVDELGIEPGPELRELESSILRQDDSLLLDASPLAMPAMQFRRLVTVLFVDVVESLALAAVLDPEALGRVLRRYFETVSATVERHGGVVEKFAGDAVMAVFGIPVSHEDDGLRAARAAVEIRSGVAVLNERLLEEHRVELEVRVGLEAGEVMATPTESRQRLVTGEVVGIASRLEQSAAAGEIVVGEVVARLIDHAARLEPLGPREIKGLGRPLATFRLVDLVPAPRAFETRSEAPLVGRKRELAALRRSLKRAVESSSARLVLVVAAPGLGKSRLAAELARRTRGISTLWGRCLSYGEGITYWPLREMLESAPESDDRAAALAALEGGASLSPPETALVFRRFCESLARERPLLVVFDDIHWGEPTLLELVTHLAELGDAPILIVCLAREELLDEHPEFLAGLGNVDRLALDALRAGESEVLLDGLGGTVLETDQRARIAEAAEGNPLFVEQLLALALEGGLSADRPLPETVQALLAARLDRLGPGERALLERAAVVGKRFVFDDVVALLEPEALPTAQAHVEALIARGFVRPAQSGRLRFRHALVQEAVYRAAPKRLRAELHERFADRLATARGDLPELDEFVGYHLEQAFRLRIELGDRGRRAEQLADDAGRRLGRAGFDALKRGDTPATISLLGRATGLLRKDDESRAELMSELAIAQYVAGDHAAAGATIDAAIADAAAAHHRRVELRALVERAYLDLLTEPEGAAAELLRVAEEAVPTFEALDDHRSLARTWLLIGYVHGGIHGNHAAWQEAEERALSHYRRTAFPPATCIGQIAAALYWGPTPVSEGIARCNQLLEEDDVGRLGQAAAMPYLGGLHAQAGRFDEARVLVGEAEAIYADLGSPAAVVHCGTVRADVELLAGDHAAAEQTLREQCAFLELARDRAHLAVRAAKLAEALYRQDRLDESREWAALARSNAASDDQSAQLLIGAVDSKLLAAGGDLVRARELAEETVRLADSTDGLNQIAATRLALAEVLDAGGLEVEAGVTIADALELFERKGNAVGASHARALLAGDVAA